MKSDLYEIAERLDGFAEVFSARKTENGTWILIMEVREDTPTAGYDVCRKLNGWDENDYFSIIRIETVVENKFIVVVKRIRNETESN